MKICPEGHANYGGVFCSECATRLVDSPPIAAVTQSPGEAAPAAATTQSPQDIPNFLRTRERVEAEVARDSEAQQYVDAQVRAPARVLAQPSALRKVIDFLNKPVG